tara:strand:+ start:14560 stop:14871 length:312 start_codon:yes stop_codon:yes gene_type:complete
MKKTIKTALSYEESKLIFLILTKKLGYKKSDILNDPDPAKSNFNKLLLDSDVMLKVAEIAFKLKPSTMKGWDDAEKAVFGVVDKFGGSMSDFVNFQTIEQEVI